MCEYSYMHVMACVWRTPDNFEESVLSFCFYVGPGDGTPGIRLAIGKHLHMLRRHFAGPYSNSQAAFGSLLSASAEAG